MSLAGVGLAIIAACGLAMQALTIRMATRNVGRSGDVLLVVIGVNIVVLVPLLLIFDPRPVLTPRSIVAFGMAGIVGTMIGRALFYAGIERIGASRAEPIKASMPIHATILAIIFLGEAITALQFAGIVLIVAGIALVSWEGRAGDRRRGIDHGLTALTLPLLAAFFFGLEPIFASIGLLEGTSIIAGLVIKSTVAMVCYVLYLAWQDSLPDRSSLPSGDLHWYVFAGLASTTFLLAYYAGLSVSRVGIVVPIMQTSPLIVVVASAIFLRRLEVVTIRVLFAASIIVVGGIMVTLGG